MSSRTAVDQFGSSVSGSNGNTINLRHTDKLYVNTSGDLMEGELNMNNNKITNIATPTNDKDAVNKKYVNDNTIEIFDESKNGYKISLVDERDSNDCSLWCHGSSTGNMLILSSNLGIQFNINNNIQLVISDNNIDFKGKRLSNVRTPVTAYECANKSYIDDLHARLKPRVFNEFVRSSQSRSFTTDNTDWYGVQLNVLIYTNYYSVFILRSQAKKVFAIRHKGDGFPGQSDYIYNYYGEVFIKDVTSNSFIVEVKNFGYTSDSDLLNFRRRDNSGNYGVASVVIM